jgi:hypothetical protein
MKTFTVKFLEDELTRRLGSLVRLKEPFYSAEEGATYRRIYVGGERTGIVFDLEDLTEYDRRGIVSQQLDRLAARLIKGE